jgi:hypothetical protein
MPYLATAGALIALWWVLDGAEQATGCGPMA